MNSKSLLSLILVLCLSLSILTGCGTANSSPEAMQDTEPESAAASVEVASAPEAEPTPEPTPNYDLNFTVAGQQISAGIESLDLSQASAEEIDRLVSVLPALPALKNLELGNAAAESPRVTWTQLRALEEGLPQASFNYSFTIQGYPFSLSDQILNLNHFTFQDEGALASEIAACMPNLKVLDMAG